MMTEANVMEKKVIDGDGMMMVTGECATEVHSQAGQGEQQIGHFLRVHLQMQEIVPGVSL